MRVECPHCGAKGEIDETKRPQRAVSIRCPRCKGSIPLNGLMDNPSTDLAEKRGGDINAPATSVTPRESPDLVSVTVPNARNFCSICNKQYPVEDMVRFGPSLVCASCKPMYVQMLEQGAARPGSLRYAGFWIRLCAKFIDNLILMAVVAACYFLMIFSVFDSPNLTPQSMNPGEFLARIGIFYLIAVGLPVAMGTFFVGRFGATPGKMACGLVVVNPEGDRVSYLRAFGRCVAEILSSLFFCIGYLLLLFDAEKRTLHDMICETRVVYK